MTITVNHVAVQTDIDDSFIPAIADRLVLDDYLGQQMGEIRGKLERIRSYVWHSEANYEQAEALCRGAIHASKNGLEVETAFFVDSVEDLLDFDRALRVSDVHKTPQPLQRRDIPDTITKRTLVAGLNKIQAVGTGEIYRLHIRKFEWSDTVPSRAAMKAAEVMIENPPDAFWIAEYVRPSSTYDPIIYASYGSWHVEVARWD
jgi:hypothetical protein